MKTILVDAVHCFIIKNINGFEVFQDMFNLLEQYKHKKLLLTGANDEEVIKFNLKIAPYKFFTLKHNPEKTNPEYFSILLNTYNLKPEDVIYFEHNMDSVKSAESIGIKSYFYDEHTKDLKSLKEFLDNNLN